jgi:hypothetical protein
MTVGLSLGYYASLFDVVAAFTEADLQDIDVYIRSPPGFKRRKFAKLKKSLYGLQSASRRWFNLICQTLKQMGFLQTSSDTCLFMTSEKPLPECILALYVDDGYLLAKTLEKRNLIRSQLSKILNLKWHDQISKLLGAEVANVTDNSILLTHTELSQALVKTNDHVVKKTPDTGLTPFSPSVYSDIKLMLSKPATPTDVAKAQSLVGSINYLARETRPDLCFIANLLGRYTTKANSYWHDLAKPLLRYLARTTDRGCIIKKTKFPAPIIATVDSDLGNDPSTQRSTTGYLIFLDEITNSNLLSWKTRLQKETATSSMDAELYAVEDCAKEVLYIRNIMKELKILSAGPTKIFCDNAPAIATIRAGSTSNRRTKYLALKLKWLHEAVNSGEIELVWIPTEDNAADYLTKAVKPRIFKKHASSTIASPTSART